MKTYFDNLDTSILLRVTIRPGGATNEVVGLYGDPARLKIKVHAKPFEGAANKAVIGFLASLLSISKSKVHIVRGNTSSNKDIQIEFSGHDHSEIVRIISNLSK
jgi:uncharacterized protein (TIGR00251 family)